MTLTAKVLWGMGLGIVVGLIMNISGLNDPGSFVNEYITNGLFWLIGKLFISGLMMLVVPLVFFSLVTGVIGIGDIRSLGKVGGKSFGLYLFTTAVAITIAILFGVVSGIGGSAPMASGAEFTAKEAPSLAQVLLDIVPTNIINAMALGKMLQVIFIAIILGIAILMVGEKAKPVVELFEIGNELMMKIVNIVMAVAPYAVFALLAKAIADLGLDLLLDLGGYVIVLILALLTHLFVTQMVLLKILSGMSPKIYLKKMKEVFVFAFSTSSSNATIPITLKAVTEKLGVKNSVASFSIPFGATINMDGTAIMQGVATVFIANIYGVELGLMGYLTVILMALLASIGTAGVPSAGLVMLSMVFIQVGIPVEGIGLVLGVDRLLDMVRTSVNVSGDGVVSVIVAKSEGKLQEDVFNDMNLNMDEEITIDRDTEKNIADMLEGFEKK
ncbi:MAG TPA: dicarboxylate/amino acid:cation symporter [Epsilonproteobacteria bacterium]|nr:dicarboxylate/amino acid:cation symporter [Campylobacterota bacterium]